MVSLDKALLKRAALRRFYTIYSRIKTFYTKKIVTKILESMNSINKAPVLHIYH